MGKSRKLACALLSLTMCAALAAPAIASSPAAKSTITITPAENSASGNADRFTAYQIFSGNVETDEASENRMLSNIEWGSAIGEHSTELIEAMKTDATLNADGGQGQKFSEYWTEYETSHADQYSDATAVAKYLEAKMKANPGEDGYGDSSFRDAFNALVADVVTKNSATGTKSQRGDNSESATGNWTITVDPGYYLIIDGLTDEQHDGRDHGSHEAASSYILEVVGDRTVDVKTSVPGIDKTVDDTIKSDDSKSNVNSTADGSSYEYTITGTSLPENYKDIVDHYKNHAEGKKFVYRFVDWMEPGITPELSTIAVTVDGTAVDESNLTVKISDNADRTHTETWQTVSDWKTSDSNGGWADGTTRTLVVEVNDMSQTQANAGSTVVLKYKAHLNEFSTAGAGSENANDNEVVIQFSNDPYSDSEGETVPAKTSTFELALEVTKLNGSTEGDPSAMQGVQFMLLKKEQDAYKLAVFEDNQGKYGTDYSQPAPENSKKLKEWVAAQKTDGTTIDASTTGCKAEEFGAENLIATSTDGKFLIEGLTAGDYVLIEVENDVTKTFDRLENIEFTIAASVSGDATSGHDLSDMSVTMTKAKRTDVKWGEDGESLGETNGVFQATILNYRAPVLPHTGGAGVYILFGVGVAVLLIGAGAYVHSRRKNDGAEVE